MTHSKSREGQTRPIGDLYSPFFNVAFFNTTGDPMEILLLSQNDQLITNLTREELPTISKLGELHSKDGFRFSAALAVLARGNSNRELSDIEDLTLKINASFKADVKVGAPFRFTLTLTPEYEDGLILLESHLLGYATIGQVKWGYITSDGTTIETRKHIFSVIQPKATFGENLTIELTGLDLISDQGKRVSSNKTWLKESNISIFDIVKELIEDHLPYKMDKADALKDVPKEHPVFSLIKNDITQNHTDWEFIAKMLRRVGLTFVIRADHVLLLDLVHPARGQDVPYTFQFRRPLIYDRDIPAYNVVGNYLPNYFQPPSARGLLSVIYDPATGKTGAKKIASKDVGASAPTTSKGKKEAKTNSMVVAAGKDHAVRQRDGTWIRVADSKPTSDKSESVGSKKSTPPTGDSLVDAARAITVETMTMSHPRVKVKAPGVVDMFPGILVDLEGASIFDKTYFVISTTHSISSGGYDMDVELMMWTMDRGDAPNAPTQAANRGGKNTTTSTKVERLDESFHVKPSKDA